MSCVRTQQQYVVLGEDGRVVAAVKILSSQANQKRSCEFQRKAMYLRVLSKNEAQARLYFSRHTWTTMCEGHCGGHFGSLYPVPLLSSAAG